MKNIKTNFQDIHYLRQKPNFALNSVLKIAEFFYKNVINFKNFLYEKNILNEKKVSAYVICVGNLTTGGVGKTPIVANLANEISKNKKVAIVSRGYGAKLSNKIPNIIKDNKEIKFQDGSLCGDEPYQLAKKVNKNVVVITSGDRVKACELAIIKFGAEVIVLDDGFSNRKIKKDKIILVIDSKMRFGNNHLLPLGPLREPIEEIKRANEIILVNKGDENFSDAVNWAKNSFNLPLKQCIMAPKRIYNMQTGATVKKNVEKVISFCAIGQPVQFFDFVERYYRQELKIAFDDHHKYTYDDIKDLLKKADELNISVFVTTQKDETKLKSLIENISGYSFCTLELENIIEEIN